MTHLDQIVLDLIIFIILHSINISTQVTVACQVTVLVESEVTVQLLWILWSVIEKYQSVSSRLTAVFWY